MLAQNFKTASDLGISDAELDALIKVLGMLERGDITHVPHVERENLQPDHGTEPIGFNITKFYGQADCGTVCCICGWAEYVGRLEPGSLMRKRFRRPQLEALFDPTGRVPDPSALTPARSAIALRSYLTTGEANWAEALA